MLKRSTVQLLRFHFSFFLLPVYLFAISQLPVVDWSNAVYVFIILHILIYPASNGYNSYMDKDTTPIGGLAKPMQPTKQLFITTILMDVIAIILSVLISYIFALGILLYILASKAYSYRGIRLKKYPIIGFLTVFIFQGAVIFYTTYHACHPQQTLSVPVLPCIISSLLIGASYPLTQIYQHDEDRSDGVTTISYLLGKKYTFIFSIFLFFLSVILMFSYFYNTAVLNDFYLFLLVTSPIVIFFLFWMLRVWRNEKYADFIHSLRMNIISTFCLTIYFSLLIIRHHFE